MSDIDKKPLTFDEAVAMLPDGDMVHTFRNGGGALIGADRDRDDLIEWLGKHPVERTGPMASGMNHGMAGMDAHGWLFIETRKETQT